MRELNVQRVKAGGGGNKIGGQLFVGIVPRGTSVISKTHICFLHQTNVRIFVGALLHGNRYRLRNGSFKNPPDDHFH